MIFTRKLHVLAAALTIFCNTAQAIPKISAVGSKYFTDDGNQWFVKGVAYQLSPDDPLVNDKQCREDAKLMKELGANAIRVYHVDPDQDHDQCMQIFADNGIYLFLDLDTFDTAINQNKPTWTDEQYSAFAKVMDAFAKYENMAGFFVGNEVISTTAGATAAPYILAAVADMKRYRDSKNYRKIPIGYSAADIAELRPMLQNYLVCHKDEENRVDFFALNSYEWCGENTFQGSGYASLQKQAEGYPVPIWFSEIGCNAVRPRTFQDLNAILGPEMNSVWSGGMAYEWIQEENDYGIVTYAAPPQPDSVSTPIPISPDFNELQSRFATLAPSGVALSDYKKQTATVSLPPCPKSSAEWALNPDAHLPTLGSRVAVLSVAEGSVTTTAHSTTGTTLLGKVNASPTPSAVSTSASTSEVSATVTNSGMYTAVPTQHENRAGVVSDSNGLINSIAIAVGLLAVMI